MPCSSAAAITSASRMLPPGWMIAVAPAAATTSTPSRNGKNASEATTEPASESPALAALMDGDARRVDAAHLARAHAERPAVAAEYDGVRLDEFGHAPREHEIGDLGLGRPRPGHDLELARAPRWPRRASARAVRRRRACNPTPRRPHARRIRQRHDQARGYWPCPPAARPPRRRWRGAITTSTNCCVTACARRPCRARG